MSSIFYSSGRLTELASPLSKDHCSRNYLVRPAKPVGMFISGKMGVVHHRLLVWASIRSVGNLEVGIFHLVFIHSESTHGRYVAELWLTENEGANYNRSLPVTGYYASGFNHPPGGIANNKIYKVYYNFMHSKIREKIIGFFQYCPWEIWFCFLLGCNLPCISIQGPGWSTWKWLFSFFSLMYWKWI